MGARQSDRPSALTASSNQGTKTVLIIRPAFLDDPADPFPSEEQPMLEAVRAFYTRNSYGKVDLSFTVSPVLMLPQTKQTYLNQPELFDPDLMNAEHEQGINPDSYDFWSVFSRTTPPGTGSGVIGGKNSFCGPPVSAAVLAHELGHNFGLTHAHSWKAANESIIGKGESVEYGNVYDVMGQPIEPIETADFSAHQRYLLGWLPENNVATITNSGIYRLEPYTTNALGENRTYALRVNKDAEREYWLEIRPYLVHYESANQGVFMTWGGTGSQWGQDYILDLFPNAFRVQTDPLLLGQSLDDRAAGLVFTAVQKIGDAIDVSVQFKGTSNSPPVLNVWVEKSSAENQPFVFHAEGTDPDNDELSYFWIFSDFVFASGPVVSHFVPFDIVAHCIASDRKGGFARRNIEIGTTAPRIIGRTTAGGKPVAGVHIAGGGFNEAYSDSDGFYVIRSAWPELDLKAYGRGMEFQPVGFTNPLSTTEDRSEINFIVGPLPYTPEIFQLGGGYAGIGWSDGCDDCLLEYREDAGAGEWLPVQSEIYRTTGRISTTEKMAPHKIFRLKREF